MPAPSKCIITDLPIKDPKEFDGGFEYNIEYKRQTYKLRFNNTSKWDESPLTSYKRLLKALLFNNKWPFDQDCIITRELTERMIRMHRSELPMADDFQSKVLYYLEWIYNNGGKEHKNTEFNPENYWAAFADDQEEFSRIFEDLQFKKFILLSSQNIFKLTLLGITTIENILSQRPQRVKYNLSDINAPTIMVINVDEDRLFQIKLEQYFSENGFGTYRINGVIRQEAGPLPASYVREARRALKDADGDSKADYWIFIKSQNSDSNNTFGSVFNIAVEAHIEFGIKENPYLISMAAIDDSKFEAWPRYTDYHDHFYDIRILSQRERLLDTLAKNWIDRQYRNPISSSSDVENLKADKIYNFPAIEVSSDDIKWLKIVYEKFLNDEESGNIQYISQYTKEFPQNYDPDKIDPVLLQGGSYITFYGIWVVDKKSLYIQGVEDVIFAIKSLIEEKGNNDVITEKDLLERTKYSMPEIYKIITLLDRFGGYFQVIQRSKTEIQLQLLHKNMIRLYTRFNSLEDALIQKLTEDNKRFKNIPLSETSEVKEPSNFESDIDYKTIDSHKASYTIRDKNIDPTMGVGELAEDMANIIEGLPGEKGQMLGIFGKWGRGKSYLINEIWKILEKRKDKKFTKVEYHAWKYQETPASWAYLYELFAKTYLNKNNTFFGGREYIKKLFALNCERYGKWRIYGYITFLILTVTLSIIIACTKSIYTLLIIPAFLIYLKKESIYDYSTKAIYLMKKYSGRHSFKNTLGLQADIQEEIIKLFKVWIPESEVDKKKVILIVEDIDRCTEDKVIQNIDALRVMLEEEELCKRLIIVTAIDERILKNAIKFKYVSKLKESDEDNTHVVFEINELTSEYLDKIFISAIKLGILSENQKEEFINKLLSNDADQETILKASEIKRKEKASKNITNLGFLNAPEIDNEEIKMALQSIENIVDKQNNLLEQFGKSNSDLAIRKGDLVIQGGDFTLEDKNGNLFSLPELEKTHEKRIIDQDQFNKLSAKELVILSKVILGWEKVSPRQIKIFYYRYLLSKNLLIRKYSKEKIVNPWQNEKGIKVLMELIVYYMNLLNPDAISKDKNNAMKSDKTHIPIPGLSNPEMIGRINCINVLEILELVIAY